MRCEEVRYEASAWLDGEMAEDRARRLAAHEAGCGDCHAWLRDLRHASGGIARLGRVTAPEGLEARVRARLDAET